MRLRLLSYAVVAGLAIWLFSPKTCDADPIDTVTLSINVTWTVVSCQTAPFAFCFPVGFKEPMTGSFQFDPDTMSVSIINEPTLDFSTLSFQSVSKQTPSHGSNIYTFVFACDQTDPDLALFCSGSLTISFLAGSWQVLPASVVGFLDEGDQFEFAGGGAEQFIEWKTPTPEPGTLALLATGLLALGPFLRGRLLERL